jgi:Phospholipid methyltransferase
MAATTKAANGKKKDESAISWNFQSLFYSKQSYLNIKDEFDQYHQHDVNVLIHLFTTGLGLWGVLQLIASVCDLPMLVYAYAGLIALTTPLVTSILHTAFVYGALHIGPSSLAWLATHVPFSSLIVENPLYVCVAAIVLGYGLQDVSHWLCCEPTYLGSYIYTKPYMLVIHSLWLLPLVLDAMVDRHLYLPYLVNPNRNVVCKVASPQAVTDLRAWIQENVPEIPETTHVWPHKQSGTDLACTNLEQDAGILAGFRTVFSTKHFDIIPVVGMNEIYVTAVGAKKSINSDAVFYTPHTDGPYWWLPGASLYRVLVGITPNCMVRTRFNLQHSSQDQVLDRNDVLGFDYNRELHWIDHVPGAKNEERRSLLKLHFLVYPRGWHRYGQWCALLNCQYNTWARNNFLRTLRPQSLYEYGLAWWIWLTTWTNAMWELYVGWNNLVYVGAAYLLTPPSVFVVLTSFRHYFVYMTTFAYRSNIAHGYLMRDAKFYKTLALIHLASRLLPLVQWPQDVVPVALAATGFTITILATVQLGMVRTYFGSELGLVPPQWISGFPYNTIPHPMIVGQLFAYANILYWFWERLSSETVALIATHMSFYTAHMVQEIFFSSY